MVLEIGTVCMKVAGREAGKYCVVLKKPEKSFVIITGPRLLTGVKRRKCNIEHLEPTEFKLEIKEEEGDTEVISAYEKAGLVTRLDLRKPSAAQVKAEKAEKAKPKEEKKEVKQEKKEEKPKENKGRLRIKIGKKKEEEKM